MDAVGIEQIQKGVTLDDLGERFGWQPSSHVKIDVDRNEPENVASEARVLGGAECCSILVEVPPNDYARATVLNRLKGLGIDCVSERSNWESCGNREREAQVLGLNMIFVRC